MNEPTAAGSTFKTADIRISGTDWEMTVRVTAPAGPATRRMMLPMLQELTNSVVNAAVGLVEQEGKSVSCRAGCGACCRQLVPLAPVDARRIAELVDEMPEPRRTAVRGRFAEARQRLQDAGMLEKFLNTADWSDGDTRTIGLAYFQLAIACPFLEDESCSIHPDRPIPCREYLVTSPAEACARPTAETVHCVELPVKVSRAALRLDDAAPGARCFPWVPLPLAPEWAATHPEGPPARTGTEWVRTIFQELTHKRMPPASGE